MDIKKLIEEEVKKQLSVVEESAIPRGRTDLFEKIVKKHGITTLRVRNSDALDFYDMSVWTLQEIMNEVYEIAVDLTLNLK